MFEEISHDNTKFRNGMPYHPKCGQRNLKGVGVVWPRVESNYYYVILLAKLGLTKLYYDENPLGGLYRVRATRAKGYYVAKRRVLKEFSLVLLRPSVGLEPSKSDTRKLLLTSERRETSMDQHRRRSIFDVISVTLSL